LEGGFEVSPSPGDCRGSTGSTNRRDAGLDSRGVRPRGGGASTSQGHPYAVFQRALKRRSVLSALAAAKDRATGSTASSSPPAAK
jgi:hypothetical protein